MTTYGYIRVSTAAQGNSGLGAAAQRSTITTAAPEATLRTEIGSAGAGKSRPVLAALLEGMRAGDVLVVAKLDRLARSTVDFGNVLASAQRGGWSLVIVDMGVDTATPSGKLVANVMAAMAEFERDMIAQRQRESAAAKRARGGRGGRVSVLEPCSVERVAELRAAGCSWAMVADALNADGCVTPTGRAWTRDSARAAAVVGDDLRAERRRVARLAGRAA